MFGTPNCSTVPDQVASDAGVAGEGVLLSFIITAFLALVVSASLILQEFRASPKPSVIRRKLLNSYSDQQIITGIGIQSVGLATVDSIVAYHFFLIWLQSLLSMATHNSTLLVLRSDFRRDWVLRWLRQVLMLVNLVLSCVYGVFVLEVKIRGLPATLPIGCVWDVSSKKSNAGGWDYAGTIIVIAGNGLVFIFASWYLQSRRKMHRVLQLAGLLLMAAIAIGATIRLLTLSSAIGTPSVKLADDGERVWNFGQLLSVLMLILPVISAIEMLRGEMAVPPPVEDEYQKPLLDINLGYVSQRGPPQV